MVITDSHGHAQHERGVEMARDFCRDYHPEIRIHLGDNWDLPAWRKGASLDELQQDTLEDVEAGLDTLDWFRPTEQNLGNHCWRLWKSAYHDQGVEGRRRDYARTLIERHIAPVWGRLGTRVYEYRIRSQTGVLGPWRHMHGFKGQFGKYSADKTALHYRGDADGVLYGHLHRPEVITCADTNGSMGVICPCLCDRDKLAYVDEEIAAYRWRVGFMYGEVGEGHFTWNMTILS